MGDSVRRSMTAELLENDVKLPGPGAINRFEKPVESFEFGEQRRKHVVLFSDRSERMLEIGRFRCESGLQIVDQGSRPLHGLAAFVELRFRLEEPAAQLMGIGGRPFVLFVHASEHLALFAIESLDVPLQMGGSTVRFEETVGGALQHGFLLLEDPGEEITGAKSTKPPACS